MVRWFQAHGLYRRHLEDNKHAVICPWRSEHSTSSKGGTDTIIFEGKDGGWPGFYCHHAHCEGRELKSVMSLWGDQDQFCVQQREVRRHG